MADLWTYAIFEYSTGAILGDRTTTKEALPAWAQPAIALLDATDTVPSITNGDKHAKLEGIGHKFVFNSTHHVDYDLYDEYIEVHRGRI